MRRALLIAVAGFALSGCGALSGAPSPKSAAFTMMEDSIQELCNRVLAPNYKNSRSNALGGEGDHISFAMTGFLNEVKGGPLEPELWALREKLVKVEGLQQKRAPVADQQAAAKELRESLEALKAKL